MNIIKISWKNLTNKPLSMLLSLLLFALGTGLISLIFLLNHQLDQKFEKNLAGIDMVLGAKGSPLQLILSSMFHVDSPTGNISIDDAKAFLRPEHPLIQQAVPLSLGDSYATYRIVGTTDDILNLYNAELSTGVLWEHPMEVTLGADVASRKGLGVGDSFQSTHGLDDNKDLVHDDADAFKVVGILKPTGSVIDQLILTSSESVWRVHDHGDAAPPVEESPGDSIQVNGEHTHDHDEHAHNASEKPLYEHTDQDITAILVKFKMRNVRTLNMPRAINENTPLLAANPSYEISKLFDQLGVGEKILRALAFVIIAVSTLSIFISLYSSLKERKYELAVMRTMGASRQKLFIMVILEGLILATLGYLLGIMVSHLGLTIFSGYLEDAYRYNFTGSEFLPIEAYMFPASLLIGFIAAVIPAIQAMNTDISTTLAEG